MKSAGNSSFGRPVASVPGLEVGVDRGERVGVGFRAHLPLGHLRRLRGIGEVAWPEQGEPLGAFERVRPLGVLGRDAVPQVDAKLRQPVLVGAERVDADQPAACGPDARPRGGGPGARPRNARSPTPARARSGRGRRSRPRRATRPCKADLTSTAESRAACSGSSRRAVQLLGQRPHVVRQSRPAVQQQRGSPDPLRCPASPATSNVRICGSLSPCASSSRPIRRSRTMSSYCGRRHATTRRPSARSAPRRTRAAGCSGTTSRRPTTPRSSPTSSARGSRGQRGRGPSSSSPLTARSSAAPTSGSTTMTSPRARTSWPAPSAARAMRRGRCGCLAQWAFEENGIERLELRVDPRNEASIPAGRTRRIHARGHRARVSPRDRRSRFDSVVFSLLPGEL